MEVTFTDAAQDWDDLVRTSPQRSPYVSSAFLRALGRPFEVALVRDGGRVVAGAPLILDDSRAALPGPVAMTMYQGVLLAESTDPPHRKIPYELETTRVLVEAIDARHRLFNLACSWRLPDLRSLSWLNYHEPQKGQLKIDLYYTGILELPKETPFDAIVGGMRELRRRERKKALGKVLVEESTDPDVLESLYIKTLARQGIERKTQDAELLLRIARGALEGGYGKIRVALLDGKLVSSNLFLYDDRTAFYLLGANDPDHRNSGASTFLMLETIRDAHERGLSEVDFIGVNSPQRGDYKVSFNADLRPFFIARMQRPNGSGS